MRIPFGKPDAIACVAGGEAAPGICGAVKFYSMGKYVFVVADICGLPKKAGGIFALHIHEGKNCTGRILQQPEAILTRRGVRILSMRETYHPCLRVTAKRFWPC